MKCSDKVCGCNDRPAKTVPNRLLTLRALVPCTSNRKKILPLVVDVHNEPIDFSFEVSI